MREEFGGAFTRLARILKRRASTLIRLVKKTGFLCTVLTHKKSSMHLHGQWYLLETCMQKLHLAKCSMESSPLPQKGHLDLKVLGFFIVRSLLLVGQPFMKVRTKMAQAAGLTKSLASLRRFTTRFTARPRGHATPNLFSLLRIVASINDFLPAR